MNIIIFPSSYLPILGGVQEVAFRLSKEILKKGHTVKIITQRYPRNLGSKEILENTPIFRILFPSIVPEISDVKSIIKYTLGLFLAPISCLRLFFLLMHEKPDIVYLHFVGAFSLYLLVCKAILNFRLIVTFHGDDVEGFPHQFRFNKWVLRRTCASAEYVTACSNYLLDRAKAICPEINYKSKAIHNGIDIDSYSEIEAYKNVRPYIFSAGRFLHKKGFDILIKAFFSLIKKGHKIDLILAGEGTEQTNYEKLINQIGFSWIKRGQEDIGLGPTITFWGKADREEMKSLLAGSEITIVPSRVEPFGLVVLEAMAAGTPVIASSVGGIPEILQADCGFLVPEGEETVLAEAMEKLLVDSDLRENLIHKGLKRAKNFNWNSVADQYLALVT